ncbi:MAG: zinc ribbon domain-containing protein [Planctomycetota bacterium]|jgi:hypothetical protein
MQLNCPSCSTGFEVGRLQQKRGEGTCPNCGKAIDIFKAQAEAREEREKPPEPDRGMPVNTKITFEINPGEWLEMEIPAEGWKPFAYILIGGGGLIFILAIIISVWFFVDGITAWLQFLPFAMIVGTAYLVLWGFSYAYGKTRIYADKESFRCTREVFNLKWTSRIPISSIKKVKPIPYSTKTSAFIPCVIGASRRIQFGHWLTAEEQGWICNVINKFMQYFRMMEEE